jgi:toxin-antitoxin system PIN domain toxin
VILVDANLLLYAYNSAADEHQKARAWLEEVMSGHEPVALCWQVLLAFLRLATNRKVFPRPLSRTEAMLIVSRWLERSQAFILEPGEKHWEILQQTVSAAKVSGPLVMDAHLAALAIEHGAILYTTDRDFARFSKLRFNNPLEES